MFAYENITSVWVCRHKKNDNIENKSNILTNQKTVNTSNLFISCYWL